MVKNSELQTLLEIEEIRERSGALRNLARIQREMDEIKVEPYSVNDAAFDRIKMNYEKTYGHDSKPDVMLGYRMAWAMQYTWVIALVHYFIL